MQYSSRREVLKSAGLIGLGLAASTGITAALASCAAPNAVQEPQTSTPANPGASPAGLALPWPYQKLDAVAAAERGYAAYYNGGCMYGAFEGIIGELAAGVGAPFNTFPSAMMKYGGAGVSGWGTLCGALNGAAAAIALLVDDKTRGPIINEVYGWYGATPLPDYTPKTPKFAAIKTSMADSQLCHISVTKWCEESGFKALSPERADRCAWLTASVVRYTVDLLNKQADATFKATFAVPASVTGCLSCHGKGGLVENVHASNQTTCTDCHDNLSANHPAK